ncbi:N-acetylated-alpha-linked acidic dipeptidase 2-like [Actinia tenebrosa]|uniref:Glutamate carboxypeptidase 2 n=1 Tax=Actinia tenebrosa TaxID=6105 RepID=A0A6P8IDT3_ACTTE|nr:N-acetylated-alpha-linked acidic dipeptidase 2-like [Actinia tenebrosa]
MKFDDELEFAYRKNKRNRRCKCLAVIALILIILVAGIVLGYFIRKSQEPEKKVNGLQKSTRAAREENQKQLRDVISSDELRENLRYLTKRPHIAGSARQKELADELAKRWRSYGFDKVEMPEYKVLLSFPQKDKPNLVTLKQRNGSVVFQTSIKEKISEESENDTLVLPPFLGYAPSGTVEGELVYVNYGRTEDFETLKNQLKVNVTGKIAIMRYGKIFRGDKVHNAALYGAIGAIIYSDPADYALLGIGPNDTFPNTPWLPPTGAQRGSIYTAHGVGDPLTPGHPAIPGVYKRPWNESGLPKIPAHPMSYGDAINFLKHIQGANVPEDWKGSLNITYKVGPGLSQGMRVRLEINNQLEVKSIFNVIGTIFGKQEPDRYVLVGSHRDSWVFGAVDAASGTAAMTEIARGLGELLKKDWRPRRTMKFCSWGGEEFSLIGSTEWVEQHSKDLAERAVSYLNMDTGVEGNFVLSAKGSPLMIETMTSQQKLVTDPNAHDDKETMYDIGVERNPSPEDPKKPNFPVVGSGSDYAPFYHVVGVPVADLSYQMGYGNKSVPYPVYHSQHDTFYWITKFIDPEFLVHKAVAQFGGSVLLTLADSPLLPLSVDFFSKRLNDSFGSLLKNDAFTKQNISLKYLGEAVDEFVLTVRRFTAMASEIKEKEDNQADDLLRRLNDQMVQVEKAFIYSDGLPGRKLVRHVLFAPELHNLYGSSSFPGVNDAIYDAKTNGNWIEVEKQISIALECVLAATEAIQPLQ